ncbi:hypothetical protein [Marivirga atlantica]|jgi:hypothetical protein|uniref:Uncharacterized protein n=1 Tax=Marivirga atlantica TaxID=1548457 RepID=A0A937ACS9_9BACT|nr:hypothetical protein [Marivirga atlantica]MBL0766586.1 hypothetical protein [Marivirga atlantica]
MDIQKAKRIAPFLYYIPTIIVVGFRVLIPHYFFLAIIIPYYAVSYYLINKTPKEERSNIDYFRLVFLTIIHLVLYTLMFWR